MSSVTCHGGVGEIGGNKLLLSVDGASLFLDFGFSFGSEGRFFEEYLQPRAGSKLHYLLRLELVPEIDGVYRRDVLWPAGLDQLHGNPSISSWNSSLQSYEDARDGGEWTPDAVFLRTPTSTTSATSRTWGTFPSSAPRRRRRSFPRSPTWGT